MQKNWLLFFFFDDVYTGENLGKSNIHIRLYYSFEILDHNI